LLSLIGFPQTDNAARLAALRPNHHHHAPVQKANRDLAYLAIVFPVINDSQGRPIEYLGATGHIQTAFCQCDVTLGVRVIYPHNLCYYNKYIKVQQGSFARTGYGRHRAGDAGRIISVLTHDRLKTEAAISASVLR
jgi:hypothetical protein